MLINRILKEEKRLEEQITRMREREGRFDLVEEYESDWEKIFAGIEELRTLSQWLKFEMIENGYKLDEFIKEESEYVRGAVARRGKEKHWAILVNDESPHVRAEVAKQGYGLDKLVYDESANVRGVVAWKIRMIDEENK